MVLSAALDNGYVFMSLVAILTSVISAVYYLAVIKQIFFDRSDYILNSELDDLNLTGNLYTQSSIVNFKFKVNNILISGSLTLLVSLLTIMILLFINIPQE
jgi:NADH-ubiquinone oxidoreductase chain 2